MSKHRLVVEEDYDFVCYGISCHLKDFRVAWHFNNQLKFNFIRGQLNLQDKQGQALDYTTFVHRDPKSHLRYFLVNNFSENQPLIKAYKQFNILMLVEGYIDLFDADRFTQILQSIESIQLVSPLPVTPFEKLQFELFEE